jgi:hypothetical protein
MMNGILIRLSKGESCSLSRYCLYINWRLSKPIAIQGTSLILDSQEAIDAWIAERRNRFPTTQKVEDKKRKLEEAVVRGQLTPEDMGLQGWKKRRTDDSSSRGHQPTRGRARGRGMGRFNHASGTVSRAQDPPIRTKPQAPPTLSSLIPAEQQDRPDSDSNSDDDAPEVVSSKPPQPLEADLTLAVQAKYVPQLRPPPKSMKRPPPPQPKPPPRNPFTSRPTLLRSVRSVLPLRF